MGPGGLAQHGPRQEPVDHVSQRLLVGGLAEISQYRAIARYGVEGRVFQFGAVLLQKCFCFLTAVLPKTLVNDEGAGCAGLTQEGGRALVRGNHALFNQVLRRQFLVAVDLGDLFVLAQYPAVLAPLFHDQLVILAPLTQRAIHLNQRLQRVGVGDQVIAVAGNVAIHRRVGEFGVGADDGFVEREAFYLP